jgi:hypothetical protein
MEVKCMRVRMICLAPLLRPVTSNIRQNIAQSDSPMERRKQQSTELTWWLVASGNTRVDHAMFRTSVLITFFVSLVIIVIFH